MMFFDVFFFRKYLKEKQTLLMNLEKQFSIYIVIDYNLEFFRNIEMIFLYNLIKTGDG